MTTLALFLLLTQTAPAGHRVEFVERNSVGVAPEVSLRVREALTAVGKKAGLRAIVSTEGCTSSACLKELSESKRASFVGVTVVKSRRGYTIDLEAVFGPRTLLQQTFVTSNDAVESNPDVRKFIAELTAKLVATVPLEEPAPAKHDVPLVEKRPSVPVPTETTPAWVETEPTRSPAPGIVVGVSAGAVALGAGLLIAGLVASANLNAELAQPVVTAFNRDEAEARANTANALMSAGSITAGLGAAGVVTGLVLLGQQPQGEPEP